MTSVENLSASFAKWREKNLKALETNMSRTLEKLAKGQPEEIAGLIEAMAYSFLSGGKRLRPLLALASAEAVGGRAKDAFPAALAVEMIHAYSLIHDDLPAMDDDKLRRGRPTCHIAFGEARAILAGDALLTLAFEVLLSGGPAEERLRRSEAALYLARSAGALGMVGGQALDLAFENLAGKKRGKGGKVSPDMARDMEMRKTGELMSAALVCGAILGGCEAGRIKKIREMGLSLGLAFQIQDDLLNLHGNAKLLGKAVGSDLERGKATLPQTMGEKKAKQLLSELTRKTLAWAAGFDKAGRNLHNLIESLIQRQS